MKIDALDHFVLYVRDIEATCAFYEKALGMQPVTFGNGRRALAFGTQKINLHQLGRPHAPVADNPVGGAGDFCLLTSIPLAEVQRHLEACGVDVFEGPVQRTGARGTLLSVYFRDPDGNLVEVSNTL